MELLTLELSSIPKTGLDETEFKKSLLTSHHIVKLDTHKDNITGLCSGSGRVQIRCHETTQEQREELITKFAEKGIMARVRSQKRVKEIIPEAISVPLNLK